jgi:hypothetical protein
VAKRQGHRDPRTITPESRTGQVTAQEDAASTPLTGIVGDTSAAASRSGDDTRRRGWFWHWNHVITQYAPLLGLKGVGLLNSYTVWTDRREESPHRGYAFPSQQSEADFYGEDRAELITINKILVALDLIEIRKEMVYRTDERGRRWKVPHNFYRVKDQGDGVTLTTRDVMRVVELADRDRAVYRYLRKLFSPRFSPIDSDNVWHQILEEVRPPRSGNASPREPSATNPAPQPAARPVTRRDAPVTAAVFFLCPMTVTARHPKRQQATAPTTARLSLMTVRMSLRKPLLHRSTMVRLPLLQAPTLVLTIPGDPLLTRSTQVSQPVLHQPTGRITKK